MKYKKSLTVPTIQYLLQQKEAHGSQYISNMSAVSDAVLELYQLIIRLNKDNPNLLPDEDIVGD